MTPAATKESGQALMMAPDVCFIPAPPPPAGPGGIPIPFPNLAMLAQAIKTTVKVLFRKKAALVEGSEIPSSKGDEAGVCQNIPPGKKGTASMKNMAKIEFKKHSGTVKLEGKGVIAHSAPTTQNAGNTAGMHSVPSQTQILVG
jgi:hypothetical protein